MGFPVNAAKNGGGAFLLLYAVFVFFVCLPVMIAEMAVGRNTEKDPIGAYNLLGKNHSGWNFAGFLAVLTPFMIAVFYLLITVWLFGYLALTFVGQLDYLATDASFGEFINSPYMFVGMIAVGAIIHLILLAKYFSKPNATSAY